jgi:hypothetical protein
MPARSIGGGDDVVGDRRRGFGPCRPERVHGSDAALAADPLAREHLSGGSMTDLQTLVLIVDVADLDMAVKLVTEAGGRMQLGVVEHGRREFVE